MKKLNVLMLIFFLLIGSVSFARTIGSLGAETETLRRDNTWLAAQVKALESEVAAVNDAVSKAERELETARRARDKDAGGMFGWLEGDVSPANQANYEAAQRRLADAKEKAAAVGKRNAELNENQERVSRLLETAERNTELTYSAILATIARQGLLGRFDAINDKVGAANTSLDMIAKKYDQTVIGTYVKDKVSKLLNSQVICESIKSCPAGGKADSKNIEKELFPNTSSSNRNYRKASGTR